MHQFLFAAPARTARMHRYAASVAIAGVVGCSPLFLSDATASTPLQPMVLSQAGTATDVRLDSQLVDNAGVIPESDKPALEGKLQEAFQSSGIKLFMVFVDSSPEAPQAYAEQLHEQHLTNDSMVIVTNVSQRTVGVSTGGDVDDGTTEDMKQALQSEFGSSDWAGGVEAAAQTLIDGSTTSGSTYAWMGAAGVAVVGAGGGLWAWSRRSRKNTEAQQLETARNITPEAKTDLAQQPLHALRTLAEEELHSTDESIRKGEEELAVATDELGEARTRSLQKAVDHSKATLNKAYGMHQRIRGGLVNSEVEERTLLTEIVSSCGSADKNLNSKAQEFAEMRQKLMNAPELLEKLLQASVSLRARVPGARAILEDLSSRVNPELLASIQDNPDIAEQEIEEVDKAIESGRELAARPAGQQGGLIDLLGGARMAIAQADSQLQAVENAETQLREAQQNLSALITEVEEEIAEAQALAGTRAEFDREGLDKAVTQAQQALTQARESGEQDPLGTYSELLAADGQLDIELDEARGANNDFRRTLDMVNRTIADVNQNLIAVEDTIRNRRQIIGVDARSASQGARDALDQAHSLRETDPKQAFLLAQQAATLTKQASRQAREDIEEFNRRNNRNNFGGGGGGSMLTGLVLGSLLSNNGGFGGGFGGGGFGGGGGGFSGGGDSFSF